eukprot:Filipodium_phascolosomae@DN8233_c0_g1_i1.p1
MLYFMAVCLVAFGPLGVWYSTSKAISETVGMFTIMKETLQYYLVLQVVKMALLSAVPHLAATSILFLIVQEALKAPLGILDAIGLHQLVKSKELSKYDRSSRMACVGFGWAACDTLATRLFTFIIGTTGLELNWSYIFQAFLSNSSFLTYLYLCPIVSMYLRPQIYNRTQVWILAAIQACLYPFLCGVLQHAVGTPYAQLAVLPLLATQAIVGLHCLRCYNSKATREAANKKE